MTGLVICHRLCCGRTCATLYPMTPRQKHTIVILAIADIVVILTLVVLVTRPSGTNPLPLSHASTEPSGRGSAKSPTARQRTCQWQAAQLLTRAGLGGTVRLTPDGLLRFEITHPVAPGQTADAAAQSVWTAFDVALVLQEQEDEAHQGEAHRHRNECAIFTQVEVIILAVRLSPSAGSGQVPSAGFRTGAHDEAHSNQAAVFSSWQISASVSVADLVAFSAGELSEDEFIERVTYTTSAIHRR